MINSRVFFINLLLYSFLRLLNFTTSFARHNFSDGGLLLHHPFQSHLVKRSAAS